MLLSRFYLFLLAYFCAFGLFFYPFASVSLLFFYFCFVPASFQNLYTMIYLLLLAIYFLWRTHWNTGVCGPDISELIALSAVSFAAIILIETIIKYRHLSNAELIE